MHFYLSNFNAKLEFCESLFLPYVNILFFFSVCGFLLIGDKMNQLGRLNVDEFLQVKDVPDVYAIGDCNDVPEIKLAYGADTQGKFVADNLKLKHEGQAMKPYNVNSTFALVCLHGRTCRHACVHALWMHFTINHLSKFHHPLHYAYNI